MRSTGGRYRLYGFGVRLNALMVAAIVHVAAFGLALYGWQQSIGNGPRQRLAAVTVLPLPQDKSRDRRLSGVPPRKAGPKPPLVKLTPKPAIAGREVGPIQAIATPEPVAHEGGREDHLALTTQAYQRAVMARLEAGRRYPMELLRAGHDGSGTILFRVDRSGRLVEASIRTSTGRKALDRAALAIVRSAAPFPEIPQELPDELAITLPITFLILDDAPTQVSLR